MRRKLDQEEAETAALREILARGGDGAFIDGVEIDHRIDAMMSRKRRHLHDVSD